MLVGTPAQGGLLRKVRCFSIYEMYGKLAITTVFWQDFVPAKAGHQDGLRLLLGQAKRESIQIQMFSQLKELIYYLNLSVVSLVQLAPGQHLLSHGGAGLRRREERDLSGLPVQERDVAPAREGGHVRDFPGPQPLL